MTRARIKWLGRIAFWCAALFAYVMAIIPGGEPGIELPNDKANHVLAFLTLAILARLGWSRSQAWIIAVLLAAFGAFIEVSQAMPLIHRDPEWDDWIADVIATIAGMVAGTVLLALIRRRRPAEDADEAA